MNDRTPVIPVGAETFWHDCKKNHYRIILADCPWTYHGDQNQGQACGKHYGMVPDEGLSRMPVMDLVQKPAVLFCWATGPKLHTAIATMEAWGFHYRCVGYIWIKTTQTGSVITGQGVRPSVIKQMAEYVLVGSTQPRGRPIKIHDEGQPQYIFDDNALCLAARPGEVHSAKPPSVRQRIDALYKDIPKVELFARERAAGWDSWGFGLDESGDKPMLESRGGQASAQDWLTKLVSG